LHLNLIDEIRVTGSKHVFLSINTTFQHKKGKNVSISEASDSDTHHWFISTTGTGIQQTNQ
jgi:hypothetical protein